MDALDTKLRTQPNLSVSQWQRLRQLVEMMDSQAASSTDIYNQRINTRQELSIPVHVIWTDHHQSNYEAWVMARNISIGGMSIIVRRMFRPGERLRVDLPQPEMPPRKLLAEVIFCRYVAEMQHEVGLRFLPAAKPNE